MQILKNRQTNKYQLNVSVFSESHEGMHYQMKWVKNGLFNAGQEFQFPPAGAEDICSPLSTGNVSQDDREHLWYLALPELSVGIVRHSAFHSRLILLAHSSNLLAVFFFSFLFKPRT